MVAEYVRALMQKRLVCRNGMDRRQLAQQMVQDDQQFRELFNGLVRRGGFLFFKDICHMTGILLLAKILSVSPGVMAVSHSAAGQTG